MKKIMIATAMGSLLLLSVPPIAGAAELSAQNAAQLSGILATERVQIAAIASQLSADQATMASVVAQLGAVRARLSTLQASDPNALGVVTQARVDVQSAANTVSTIQARQRLFVTFLSGMADAMRSLVSLLVQLKAS